MFIAFIFIARLMAGCATPYNYVWPAAPSDLESKTKALLNVKDLSANYQALKQILIENNTQLKLRRAMIEIQKNTGKNLIEHLPQGSLSYDFRYSNLQLGFSRLMDPIISRAVGEDNSTLMLMECQLQVLSYNLTSELSNSIEEIIECKRRIEILTQDLADCEKWDAYYRTIHERGLLDNWEIILRNNQDRISTLKKQIFDANNRISQAKSRIYMLCGSVKSPEGGLDE
jgi:hypothetical protein